MKPARRARIVTEGKSGTIAMADMNADVTHGNGLAGIFARSFEQALEQQRSLWEQVTRFARDESYRFGSRQLEHANKALDVMHNSPDMPAMVGAHHGWLRELVRDYADQSIRTGEMMRDLSSNAFALALDAGYRGMAKGQDAMRATAEQAGETVETLHNSGQAMAVAASEGTSEIAGHMTEQGAEAFGNAHLHH